MGKIPNVDLLEIKSPTRHLRTRQLQGYKRKSYFISYLEDGNSSEHVRTLAANVDDNSQWTNLNDSNNNNKGTKMIHENRHALTQNFDPAQASVKSNASVIKEERVPTVPTLSSEMNVKVN